MELNGTPTISIAMIDSRIKSQKKKIRNKKLVESYHLNPSTQ